MSASLQSTRRVKCTYNDCQASFDTEKEMKRHKRHAQEHDYCPKCDEDFLSYDEYALHKAFRPNEHGKACRICGEEYKTESALKRHIELNHRVDQKLPCVGCDSQFHSASLLIEHLEFGHCETITSSQFQGHIVHKNLISKLLEGGKDYEDFMRKISQYDAAIDKDDEGGVSLGILDEEPTEVDYSEYESAIAPVVPEESLKIIAVPESYPPLPSQTKTTGVDLNLGSSMSKVTLGEDDESTTVASTFGESRISRTSRQPKAWGSRRTTSSLFPTAEQKPQEWSISAHDQKDEEQHGINILKSRFWDPESVDYKPERFFNALNNTYYCPFPCKQKFDIPADLNKHINEDHRIAKMRCPSCLKLYQSCTALVAHCESRGSKCRINQAEDFNVFLDRLTGGFLSVDCKTRPEFLDDEPVSILDYEAGGYVQYKPPTASYLQYETTKPADWKEPERRIAYEVGGGRITGQHATPLPAWK
ncbi:hypothetical protein BCR34DRAFT_600102 [Clohesyomyces aquaticus]|uniref:C2H2-type domain-containing protein n=1 Tax=Clohesyomyces aquaticus TaxID=1231657 RepID=A0A1Y1ZSI3_9PLEO|nr:hypothetical protein BCR34DRAFT_600102 [Clohesyomyces aquaticus]